MSTPESLDFTNQPVPDSWVEAASEAPLPDDRRKRSNKAERGAPPVATSFDLFTACLAAGAASIVSGYAWYELQLSGFTSPWAAVGLGLVIALSVRLGGGPEDVQTRGVLALLIYLITSSVVIYLIARTNYLDLYGSRPDLTDFEQELLHSRLTEPLAIVAWLAGATTAAWSAKLLR
ncbi:MAG: hypothetical protein GY939_07145 [Actinomycetia bacterium]|nr:hypothetical protein [Actinomycetes bacterium]